MAAYLAGRPMIHREWLLLICLSQSSDRCSRPECLVPASGTACTRRTTAGRVYKRRYAIAQLIYHIALPLLECRTGIDGQCRSYSHSHFVSFGQDPGVLIERGETGSIPLCLGSETLGTRYGYRKQYRQTGVEGRCNGVRED